VTSLGYRVANRENKRQYVVGDTGLLDSNEPVAVNLTFKEKEYEKNCVFVSGNCSVNTCFSLCRTRCRRLQGPWAFHKDEKLLHP
jgi:hypothetical protein